MGPSLLEGFAKVLQAVDLIVSELRSSQKPGTVLEALLMKSLPARLRMKGASRPMHDAVLPLWLVTMHSGLLYPEPQALSQ